MRYSLWLEKKVSLDLSPSAMPEAEYTVAICFPKTMQGLRILDVGAGQSGCVSWCASRGADAYGIDPRYGDLERLDIDTDRSLEDIRKKFLRDFGHDWESYRASIEYSRRRFREHLQADGDHYKEAFAGNLPFPDNWFDFVYSINCITHGLDLEYSVFGKAVQETMRVLKSGCEMQTYPFFWSSDSQILKNHKKLLRTLRGRNIQCIEEQVVGTARRLRIIKP